MKLGELKKKIDKLLREGVSKDTPIAVDLMSFDDKRKLPSWTVMNAEGLDLEAIDLCDLNGNPLKDDTGIVLKQFNVVLK
jgi:hypothetical protein